MTDQLSMELATGLPHPPSRLRPMLPRPLPEPFDSAEHLFEPSWGGERVLAFVEPAVREAERGGFETAEGRPSLRLIDAGGRDLAERLPELAALPLRVEAGSAVLDGELVVVGALGRPDPAALSSRLEGRPGPDVALLVFDILDVEGRPLIGRPLTRRREELRRILRPGSEIVAVPAIVGEGRALYDAVLAQGLAGMLARQRSSPYLPGVRSRLWRWIAARPAVGSVAGGPAAEGGSAAGGSAEAAAGAVDAGGEGAVDAGGEGAAPGGTGGEGAVDRGGEGAAPGGTSAGAGIAPSEPARLGRGRSRRAGAAPEPGPWAHTDDDGGSAPGSTAAGVIAVFRRLPLEPADEDPG